MNTKLVANALSATHACLGIYLAMIEDYNKLKMVSTVYFLCDVIYILRRGYQSFLMQMAYIYHHVISVFILLNYEKIFIPVIKNAFIWAELSNLTTYIVYYYLHKEGDHSKKIKILRQIQMMVWIFVRVNVMSYYMILLYKRTERAPFYLTIPIYLMGISWTATITKQYFRKKLKN